MPRWLLGHLWETSVLWYFLPLTELSLSTRVSRLFRKTYSFTISKWHSELAMLTSWILSWFPYCALHNETLSFPSSNNPDRWQCTQCHIYSNRQSSGLQLSRCLFVPGNIWSYSWTRVSTLHPLFGITLNSAMNHSNYVDAATAASENLTFSSGDHFVLRADYKKVLSSSGPGRDSVRLESKKQYTTSVTVWVSGTWASFKIFWKSIRFFLTSDIDSMYDICHEVVGTWFLLDAWSNHEVNNGRTWPAIWTVGADWPNQVCLRVSSIIAVSYINLNINFRAR